MYAFAAPQRSNPPGWALAVGAFIADRAIRSVEDGWRSPHARGLRLAAAGHRGDAAHARARAAAGARSPPSASTGSRPAVRRLYRQEELARTLRGRRRAATAAARRAPADYDVLVVGGGPGGSSAATFLVARRAHGGGGRARGLPALPRGRVAAARQHAGAASGSACSTRSKARGFLVEVRGVLSRPGDGPRPSVLLPGGQALAPLHLRGPARRVRQDPARPRRPPAERDAAAARDASSAWPSTPTA